MGVIRKLDGQDTNGMVYIRIEEYLRNLFIKNLSLFSGFIILYQLHFLWHVFPLQQVLIYLQTFDYRA